MKVRRSFPARPASVTEARHFVVSALPDISDEALGVIALMVSELATNAVIHAETAFTVAIESAAGAIRIEVTDAAPGEPEMGWPEPTDLHGRGLRIVDQLSSAWGVLPSPAGREGKTVWFSVALPESQSDGQRPQKTTRRVHAENGSRK